MASFPGATTQWRSISAKIPGPWTQANDTEANDYAKDVAGRIEDLRTQAEDLAVQASVYVDACAQFQAPQISVNMPMPEYTVGAFAQPSIIDGLELADLPGIPELDDYDFEVSDDSFYFSQHTGVAASDPSPFDLPGAVSYIDVPSDPEADDIPLPEAPEFLEITGALPEAPAAPKLPDVGSNVSFIDAENIPAIDISTDNLMEILDGVITAAGKLSTNLPEFEELDYSPDKVSAPHDAFHIVRSHNLSARRTANLSKVWVQRGVNTSYNDHIGVYLQAHDALDNSDSATVAEAEAIRYSLADARQDIGLAAALYGQTVEVQSALFGARVAQLEAQASAQRFVWDAMTMAYKGAVAAASAGLSNNELSNTALGLDASVYKSQLRRHTLLSRRNSLRHAIFAAEENSKRIFSTLANTTASRMRAGIAEHRVLTAFKAAKLRRLGEEITKFRQQITVWQADLAKVRSTYATYSAQARAAAVQNGLIASKVQTDNVRLDRVIEANRQLATMTKIAVADARLNAKSRDTENLQVQAINQVEAVSAQIEAADYGATAMFDAVSDTSLRAELTGISYENEAASKFFIAASEGTHRAATIAQQANIQLANAYNTTQLAAGKAYASIEAGRLSGWNASAAMEAKGTLTAQTNEQRQVIDAYRTEVTESDSEREDTTEK